MSIKVALKAICAAAVLATAGAANAGLFYIDIGTAYGPAGGQVNATSTSMKNQMTFQYQSTTTFTDKDNSLSLSVGDTTVTNAGLVGGADPSLNNVTGFTPNQFGATKSNNGYGTHWMLSFGIENLTGQISSLSTAPATLGAPEVNYNAGAVLKMYLFTDADGFTTANNFMNINITGGFSGTGGTILNGMVDFTGTDAGFRNIFHSGTQSCLGSNSFYDIWLNCGAPPSAMNIQFRGDFNTDVDILTSAGPIGVDADGHLLIQVKDAKHDGSATFDIPEPATLALAGLALIGVGVSRRRKTA